MKKASITAVASYFPDTASIAKCGDTMYVFCNGNNCGETGFSYAVLESW